MEEEESCGAKSCKHGVTTVPGAENTELDERFFFLNCSVSGGHRGLSCWRWNGLDHDGLGSSTSDMDSSREIFSSN